MRLPSLVSIECCAVMALVAGAQAFNVNVRQVRGLENGVFTAANFEANGENFSLVVPPGWQASSSAQENSLSLSSRSGESPIVIRFLTQDAKPLLASTDALRESVVPFLKDATVVDEFPAHSGHGSGRGVDFSFLLESSSMKSRVVVIPLSQGCVSFTLTCSDANWAAAQQSFSRMLTSFRRGATKTSGEYAKIDEQQWQREKRARVKASASEQRFPPRPHPMEQVIAAAEPEKPIPPSILEGRKDHVMLGFACVLVAMLSTSTLIRHKREAEIRALTGRYLVDGTEAARFKMPALFELPPEDNSAVGGRAASSNDGVDENGPALAGPVAEFFAQAPERLEEMRKLLSEFGKAFDDAERQQVLLKLHELVGVLKSKAGYWDLRPVWQMSSALELLLKRLAEKGKEATPSTIRTVASAIDLIADLCVPGVRPDLIINPPISVLAVDDDPLCLRAVVFALQKAEMTPDVAENGEKAVALATERLYDVVFMDIEMPGIDGLEACVKIHETQRNQTTPVVFVTVRSDFHTRAQSTLKGGTDLMAKPFLMFEITVKALTLTMRKRLQLAASCERAVSPFAPPPRTARPAVQPEPNKSIAADAPSSTTAASARGCSEDKEGPLTTTDNPVPAEVASATLGAGNEDSPQLLAPLNTRRMKRKQQFTASRSAKMKQETVAAKP